MERWRLGTLKPLLAEKGQHMLFVRKRATKHDVGPEIGVEGSPREVLRVEEHSFSGLRSFSKIQLDI